METELEIESPVAEQEKILTREEILKITSMLIEELKTSPRKRFRDPDLEKLRSGWTRIALSAIEAHASILRDMELEDMKRRLDGLECVKGEKNDNRV